MSSELAKTATWLPEEFEPFTPQRAELHEVRFPEPPVENSHFAQTSEEEHGDFSLPKSFWNDLWKDPVLSVEFENFIQERVAGLVKATLDKDRDAAIKQGFDQGLEEGKKSGFEEGQRKSLEEFKAHYTESRKVVDSFMEEVMSQKKALLIDHEKEWAQALIHVIQKLQVKEPNLFANGIKKWVTDKLLDFTNTSRIRIFVSKHDYDPVSLIFTKEELAHMEVIVDIELEKGQVRCDCGEGGVFFSKQNGFALLDQYLDENFTTGRQE